MAPDVSRAVDAPFRRRNAARTPANREPLPTLARSERFFSNIPLTGLLDNVTSYQDVLRRQEIATRTGEQYTGPVLGTMRLKTSFDDSDPPRNAVLQEYLNDIGRRERTAARKRKADIVDEADMLDLVAGKEGARPDGGRRQTRARTDRRTVDDEEIARYQDILLPMRDYVAEGVANTAWRERSSPFALNTDELVDGVETLGGEGVAPFRLMDHQKDAIGRLEDILARHRAGLLADDMGMGKTIVIIALTKRLLDRLKAQGRRGQQVIIVVPPPLISTWLEEFRQVPSLVVKHIKKNPLSDAELAGCDVVLVSYKTIETAYSEIRQTERDFAMVQEGYEDEIKRRVDALAADDKKQQGRSKRNAPVLKPIRRTLADVPLLSHRFVAIILDEAHKIRNSNTLAACGVRQVHAEFRLAMTGTPLQNSLEDFGSLLLFFKLPPFQVLEMFKSCFMTKQWRIDLIPESKTMYHDNDAIVSSIRSAIGIRRVRNQQFNDAPILGVPNWSSHVYDCELSSEPQTYQNECRIVWDLDFKRRIELREDDEVHQDAGLKDDAFIVLLKSRMHVIHPKLLEAKYSEFGVEDLKSMTTDTLADITFEVIREDDNGIRRDARIDTDRVQARYDRETSKEKKAKLAARRAEFLDFFKRNKKAWRSDRLFAVAETLDATLRQRRREAEQLPTAEERKEYLATHKSLIFCEFLMPLDILEIGLKENFGIEISRFDGTMETRQRDLARYEFEEIENGTAKDFGDPNVEPSQYFAMAGTLRACMEGITLIHASDVFIISPSYNPFNEDQLIGRAVRKGQKSLVAVRRFYSEQSIESHILRIQASKRRQTSKILDDNFVASRGPHIQSYDDDRFLQAVGMPFVLENLRRGKLEACEVPRKERRGYLAVL